MHAKIIPFPVARRIMSDEHWSKEVLRLKRRIEKIALAQAGKADVKRVKVEGGWVKRHWREGHTRIMISLRDGKIREE